MHTVHLILRGIFMLFSNSIESIFCDLFSLSPSVLLYPRTLYTFIFIFCFAYSFQCAHIAPLLTFYAFRPYGCLCVCAKWFMCCVNSLLMHIQLTGMADSILLCQCVCWFERILYLFFSFFSTSFGIRWNSMCVWYWFFKWIFLLFIVQVKIFRN